MKIQIQIDIDKDRLYRQSETDERVRQTENLRYDKVRQIGDRQIGRDRDRERESWIEKKQRDRKKRDIERLDRLGKLERLDRQIGKQRQVRQKDLKEQVGQIDWMEQVDLIDQLQIRPIIYRQVRQTRQV